MYKIMMRIRGEKFYTITNTLVTPAGTNHGQFILEDFDAKTIVLQVIFLLDCI